MSAKSSLKQTLVRGTRTYKADVLKGLNYSVIVCSQTTILVTRTLYTTDILMSNVLTSFVGP